MHVSPVMTVIVTGLVIGGRREWITTAPSRLQLLAGGLAESDCAADDAIDRARVGLQARIGRTRARIDGNQAAEPDGLTDRDLRRALNAAEHAELARLYDDGTISQPTRQQLQRGLDLEAARLGDDQH